MQPSMHVCVCMCVWSFPYAAVSFLLPLCREQEKEFLAKRIEDAYELMNDILASKPSLTASPLHTHTTFTLPSSSCPLHSNPLTNDRI